MNSNKLVLVFMTQLNSHLVVLTKSLNANQISEFCLQNF
jgi:hypothetical protein